MRRPKNPLTAAKVRQALPPGKYFDGLGLYLRVEANGAKQWVQRIVIRGKRRELGLGSPPVTSLVEARDLALRNAKLAKAGGDPIEERKRAKAVMTFQEAAAKVHELHKPTWRNAKHADDFLNSLKTYAFPRLGALRVTEVSTADVLAALSEIWTLKPETARRVRQRIGTVLKWSIAQGWRRDNPAENIGLALPKHDRTRLHRLALPYSDVASCIEKVQASNAWRGTKLALEFLVLTASRSKEVREATWSEFNFGSVSLSELRANKQSVWEIPGARMKMKRLHRVPLPARAVEILREAEKLRGDGDWVFPGARGHAISDMTLSKLIKELGFNADVHGFRTSFRTWAQEKTNAPREVAEAALAHSVGDAVEAAYARSDLFEKRRKLMEAWATYLAASRTAPKNALAFSQ